MFGKCEKKKGHIGAAVVVGMLAAVALVMVIAVQSINLTVSLINSEEKQKNDMVLTTENIFEVSSKDNVIVFLLDRFDIYYYEQVLKQDADFFAPLDGFTFYDNNISLYSRTYPAVAYMLTGVDGTEIADGEHYELVYEQ